MAEDLQNNVGPEESDDSEWEYEYHPTDTEVSLPLKYHCAFHAKVLKSFYVTLDLSAAAAIAHPKKKPEKKPDFPQPESISKNAALNLHGQSENPNVDSQDGPAHQEPAANDVAGTHVSILDPEQANQPAANPQHHIQILDLHTFNPIVSYKDQLYSCTWGSTLGTDVLLTAADAPPDLEDSPEPIPAKANVLAFTSIKISGRPVQLNPRPASYYRPTSQPSTNNKPSAPNASTQISTPSTIKIPIGNVPSLARQTQASFLERIIALKRQKNEPDQVTVHATNPKTPYKSRTRNPSKRLQTPSLIPETLNLDAPPTIPRGNPRTGRPRTQRRSRGDRQIVGGLFRDYRPQLHDTAGADTRATPDRWEELEPGTGASGKRAGKRRKSGSVMERRGGGGGGKLGGQEEWRERLMRHLNGGLGEHGGGDGEEAFGEDGGAGAGGMRGNEAIGEEGAGVHTVAAGLTSRDGGGLLRGVLAAATAARGATPPGASTAFAASSAGRRDNLEEGGATDGGDVEMLDL